MTSMDNNFVILLFSIWIVVIGIFFVITFLLYDRISVFKKIGNIFIEFSLIKRTKLILLSYGCLALFIGVIGLLVSLNF